MLITVRVQRVTLYLKVKRDIICMLWFCYVIPRFKAKLHSFSHQNGKINEPNRMGRAKSSHLVQQ